MLHEALRIERTGADRTEAPFLLVNVALVHETQGHLTEAARFAAQALPAARESGEPMIEAAALLARARVAARQDRDRRALPDVHAALAIAAKLTSPPLRVQCLSTAGVVLAAAGDVGFGVGLVRWAMAQRDFAPSEREDAARHLAALGLADAAGDALPATLTAEELVARLPLV